LKEHSLELFEQPRPADGLTVGFVYDNFDACWYRVAVDAHQRPRGLKKYIGKSWRGEPGEQNASLNLPTPDQVLVIGAEAQNGPGEQCRSFGEEKAKRDRRESVQYHRNPVPNIVPRQSHFAFCQSSEN
jgi:hypothetical protein